MPARTSEGQFIADATCSGGNSALSVQYMLTPNADESKTPNENDRDSHCRKRSPNITQCIRVPSSEHVAEIVGRQGCKIKALRARTNTYIKTPTRGQEPIFVITGRKEDVTRAQFEIQLAVDHFTRLRSKHQDEPEQAESDESECTDGGACSSVSPFTSLIAPSSVHAALAHLANIPGNVTALLAVPVHIVGLIVGPKGVTIKRIQHETKTYIVTPSREKDSVFQITGPPEGVERAQREIEQHVLARTGYSVVELMEQRKVMHGSARPSLAESCADSSCSSTSSAATDSLLLGTSPADCHARLQLLHASLRGAKALSRAAAAEANCTPPELHSLLHTPIKQQSLEDCIDWFRPTACRPGRGAIGTHALPARPAGQSWSANGDGIADLLSSKLFIAPSSLVPPAPRSRLLDLQLIAKNAEAQDHCLDEMVANTRNLAHRFSNHQLPVRNCKTPGLDCTVSEMDKSGDEDYCFSGNCFTLPETGFEYLRTQLDAKRRMQS